MKRFEDFTQAELWELRGQIVLGSIYVADHRNDFGIDEHSVCDFFDSFLSYIEDLAREEGNGNLDWDEIIKMYDNPETLWDFYWRYEDFSWVEYKDDDFAFAV